MSGSNTTMPRELKLLNRAALTIIESQSEGAIGSQQEERYRSALKALEQALRKTIQYTRSLKDGAEQDFDKEDEIHSLWSKASREIAPIDRHLSQACMMKGLGWSDPKKWKDAYKNNVKISIANMEDALLKLTEQFGEVSNMPQIPNWFPIAGLVFAFMTFVSLFYLVVGPSDIDPTRKNIFNIWIAFCMAASFAFIGGYATAKGKLPIPMLKDKPMQFSVGGGFAVFVVTIILLNIFGL